MFHGLRRSNESAPSDSARSIEVIGPGVFHRFNAGELHSTPARTIYRFTPGEFTTLFCACHPEIRAGVTARPSLPSSLPNSDAARCQQDIGSGIMVNCVKLRYIVWLVNRFNVIKINYVQDPQHRRSAGLDEANVRIICKPACLVLKYRFYFYLCMPSQVLPRN